MSEDSAKLRLNQAIAKTGWCSRRKADELILSGKVKLNGQVCRQFNALVDELADVLEVDGQQLAFKQFTYVALNKPKGAVTTMSDEQGRQSVSAFLPPKLRHLKPCGRLDMYSEGLLILTNDGNFALRLTHPRHHLPKKYLVLVKGVLSDRELRHLERGVPLEDGMTLPACVKLVSRNKSYSEVEITLIEGRNRQLRRMFAYLGHAVVSLVRLAIGGLQLGQIAPGSWRYLKAEEISQLLSESTH